MDPLTRLALKAQGGNRLALGTFIRETQPEVWRLCDRLGPKGEGDDLTQDVYIRMMKSLPSFRGESSARTWLLSIARNTAADALRSKARRERLTRFTSRAEVIAQMDQSFDVSSLLEVLDRNQREAFFMTQILGLSYQESAEVCDCAIGTIRSRVARARDRLILELDLSEREDACALGDSV